EDLRANAQMGQRRGQCQAAHAAADDRDVQHGLAIVAQRRCPGLAGQGQQLQVTLVARLQRGKRGGVRGRQTVHGWGIVLRSGEQSGLGESKEMEEAQTPAMAWASCSWHWSSEAAVSRSASSRTSAGAERVFPWALMAPK